jgi:predicted transcriptional regulator
MDALEDAESYLTTREIAREVNEQTVMVRDRLNRLFTQGTVARADIFHHSNRRAMNVLWATDPEKFL